MTAGAERTQHMRRTASAPGVVPFAVAVLSTAFLRARIERPRGDLRSRLWRGLLGLRLGHWGKGQWRVRGVQIRQTLCGYAWAHLTRVLSLGQQSQSRHL